MILQARYTNYEYGGEGEKSTWTYDYDVYISYTFNYVTEENNKVTTTLHNDPSAQNNGGEITSDQFATAAALALFDGPEPFVMDLVATAYLTYAWLSAGKGNSNYPGPWSYTYQHPSQHPPNNPMRGFDPKDPPNWRSGGAKILIGGKLLYEMYDEYQNQIKNITPTYIPSAKDNTYVAPQFIPVPYKPL